MQARANLLLAENNQYLTIDQLLDYENRRARNVDVAVAIQSAGQVSNFTISVNENARNPNVAIAAAQNVFRQLNVEAPASAVQRLAAHLQASVAVGYTLRVPDTPSVAAFNASVLVGNAAYTVEVPRDAKFTDVALAFCNENADAVVAEANGESVQLRSMPNCAASVASVLVSQYESVLTPWLQQPVDLAAGVEA